MKRRYFLLVLILILPLLSAVDVSMNSEYSKGETLLAIVSGNFVDQIAPENVIFYRGHVKIPVVYEVEKINGDFYISALLTDKNPGNYSLAIEGVRYFRATEIVDDDIVSNFSISEETAEFSIDPGFVSTETSFSVEVLNLQDNKIILDISEDSGFISSDTSLELNTGEKKEIIFQVEEPDETGFETITFSSGNFSYSMPVYLITDKTIGKPDFDMQFEPDSVSVTLATDSDARRILYLANTGEDRIEDISFFISPVLEDYIVISPEEISNLDPGENKQVEIQIVSDLEEAIIEGEVVAYAENVSAKMVLVLDFVKDFIPSDGEDDRKNATVTVCSDLENGKFCGENQKCTGETVAVKDGLCCVAECEDIKQSSSGKLIGWGLLVVALLFIFWFYKKKYKKVGKKKLF